LPFFPALREGCDHCNSSPVLRGPLSQRSTEYHPFRRDERPERAGASDERHYLPRKDEYSNVWKAEREADDYRSPRRDGAALDLSRGSSQGARQLLAQRAFRPADEV